MKNVVRTLLFVIYAIFLAALGGCSLYLLTRLVAADTGHVSLKNWGISNSRSDSTIHAFEAWKITRGDRHVTVAVIDTGVDPNHPSLKGRVLEGFNFVSNTTDTMDDHGHGTHVAGIIAATMKEKVGVAGVAPNVSILPVKYYVDSNTGMKNLANTVKAIRFAVQSGAQIINYSGGGPEFAEEEYLALKFAEARGVLVVTAAGNERSNSDLSENYYYPSAYRLSNIVVVGASDINDQMIRSSNWGPTKVDLTAPGENIFSTLPHERYGFMTGTSQATAFVSGVAALVLSKYPNLKPAQIKEILCRSVDRSAALLGKVRCGGHVNASRALAVAGGDK